MKAEAIDYDFQDGMILLIGKATGRVYKRKIARPAMELLHARMPNMRMLEREICGLNRWIMGKDDILDTHVMKSEQERMFCISDSLYNKLAQMPRK